MFGVVPKTLWSKHQAPDELNRVEAGLNCYVVEDGESRILIETGIGVRHDSVTRERIGMPDPPGLVEVLAEHGFEADSIDLVINTHLHWDHVGGNTLGEGDRVVPAFPNARYVTQAGELEHARERHPRDAVSYRSINYEPLVATGTMQLLDKPSTEVHGGVYVDVARGHNRDMMVVRVDSDGESYIHLADLAPFSAQVTPTWVSGFDLFPLDTIASKTAILRRCADRGTWCSFGHDPKVAFAKIAVEEGKWGVRQSLS